VAGLLESLARGERHSVDRSTLGIHRAGLISFAVARSRKR
jgi:hypothetical protein